MMRLAAALLGLGITTTSFAGGGHEHGVATLQVAVDGGQLAVELQTPLDNLVGFEHAPRTDAQRKALADAEARLRDFERLFVLPAAAGCKLGEVALESPGAEEDGHGHASHADEEGHGEMHVHYSLTCADPAALGALQVKLAEAFPRMARIRAETATARGQGTATLSRTRTRLPL